MSNLSIVQEFPADFIVQRDRYRDRRALGLLLHDGMTATLSDEDEAALGEQLAQLLAREDAQPNQRQPRRG